MAKPPKDITCTGRNRARYNRWGALALLVAGLLVTVLAALYDKATIDAVEHREFDFTGNEIRLNIAARLAACAEILRSGAALFDASESVERAEWRVFTQGLQIEPQLPGIQGVGFARLIPREQLAEHIQAMQREGFPDYQVKPAGDRENYSAIVYLEPFADRNLRAFGYDMLSEPVRRLAMERARDENGVALSRKVILVQETGKDVQAGALMYVPVYRHGLPHDTVEQRRAAIQGWVYSPYRMADLMRGTLGGWETRQKKRQLSLQIYDGAELSAAALLYDSQPAAPAPAAGSWATQLIPVDFGGHRWTLRVTQLGGPDEAADYASVWIVLGSGTTISLLLYGLMLAWLGTRARAQRLAERFTAELRDSAEALRRTTERLGMAARAGGVGIWDYDVVNNRLVWDEQMFRLYGITREQFSGAYEAWQAGVHPDDRQRGDDEIQLALQGRKEFDIVFRVLWPDGTTHHIRGFASVQRDVNDRPLRMIGTNWDITEQTRAENALRESEESYRNQFTGNSAVMLLIDPANGAILDANAAALRFYGFPREQFLTMQIADLNTQTADETRQHMATVMLKTGQRFNYRHRLADGSTRHVDVSLSRIQFGGRAVLHAIVHDVTARRIAEKAQHESEANFRTFFETITDMIVVGTPDGRILFTNTAVTRTLGYSAEDLAALRLLELHPADKRQEAEAIFTAMLRNERESCPLPLAHKDGRLVPVETRVWLGKWNGKDCIFGICKNLSAEQEAMQRFERLFRRNPSLMALSSLPDRRFADVNDAFLQTLGYARDEVIGKTATDIGFFVRPEQQSAAAEQLLAAGSVSHIEMQVRRKDGVILDGLFSGEVISSQGRQYLLTVMVDISARKRSEAELARLSGIQRELMRLATDFVNVPVERQNTAIDQSLATMGQLIQADRAYLFAYDFARGATCNTHEWCGPGIAPEIGNLQAVPVTMIPDWVAAHKRGEPMHIPSVAALPAANPLRQLLEPQGIRSLITLPLMQDTACLGFVGFDAVREQRLWQKEEVALLRVLAELYANFEARRAAERATRELQERLVQARDEAQAAARAKSLFLANMSHEIRTPLNAILGYAQIMERECQPCPVKPRLNAITRSGEHLLELITDLLELVRSDATIVSLAPSTFDIHQTLEDVRIMFIPRTDAQELAMEVTVSPAVPRFICADKGKIRQVLVNLVGNAVKFTRKGSVLLTASLLADCGADGITLAVEVEDTGCGVGSDELERIFELFYLARDNRNTGKGAGLGLPLSRRYARALGGDVTITSRHGEGSCFRFTFNAQAAKSAPALPRRESVWRLAADQPPCRILAVDDDPVSREMLTAMLEPVGFTVESVANAAQALLRLRQTGTIDLVLMDKTMPEMDGYEAIRRIRELPGGHRLFVLVVTAAGLADEREKAFAIGADGYVAKPVRRKQLLQEIGRVAGVRYDYDPVPVADPAATRIASLTPEDLRRLPAEQYRDLEQALHRGDIRRLRETVEAIARNHAGLAALIRPLVDTYAYDRLRRLFETAKGKAP